MRRRGLLVALGAAAAAGIVAAVIILVSGGSTPKSAQSGFWGVVNTDPALSDHDLDLMQQGNIASVRWTLYRPGIEAVNGRFNWQQADAIIGGLASRGIGVLPIMYGSPPYAAGTPATPPLGSPGAEEGWSRFLREAVQRYGPEGAFWTDPSLYPAQHPGAAAMPISAWQIWNEPNLENFFQPKPSVQKYAKLLRISHDAIERTDPGAIIVLAGMPPFAAVPGWRFLNGLYDAGAERDFDVVAVHPYAPTLHGQRMTFDRVRRVMDAHGDADTPIWVTELGWASARPITAFSKGPRGQARMLAGSFRLILRGRRRWNIQRVYWFNFRDPQTPVGTCNVCSYSGLFNAEGQPKPSWRTYERFTGARP